MTICFLSDMGKPLKMYNRDYKKSPVLHCHLESNSPKRGYKNIQKIWRKKYTALSAASKAIINQNFKKERCFGFGIYLDEQKKTIKTIPHPK